MVIILKQLLTLSTGYCNTKQKFVNRIGYRIPITLIQLHDPENRLFS